MYVDTEEFLKPMLYTGEGLGETGDIVLINQDGLILMSLKFPLKDGNRADILEYRVTAKPAVLASQGKEGIVAAEDYRGIPVLAAYRHLRVAPDSGWGMVVKRDQEEVFGPVWRQIARSSLVAILGFAHRGSDGNPRFEPNIAPDPKTLFYGSGSRSRQS